VALGVAFEIDTAVGVTPLALSSTWLFTPPVRGEANRQNRLRYPQTARARFGVYARRVPVPVSVVIVDGVATETRVPADGPDVFQGGRTYTLASDDPRLPALAEKYGEPELVRA
jgi:hypothetical protein